MLPRFSAGKLKISSGERVRKQMTCVTIFVPFFSAGRCLFSYQFGRWFALIRRPLFSAYIFILFSRAKVVGTLLFFFYTSTYIQIDGYFGISKIRYESPIFFVFK